MESIEKQINKLPTYIPDKQNALQSQNEYKTCNEPDESLDESYRGALKYDMGTQALVQQLQIGHFSNRDD
jgi:hypothetical protein